MEKTMDEVLLELRKALWSGETGEHSGIPQIKPAVVIGLGGSGAKVVARLKGRMDTWAEEFAATYAHINKVEGVPEDETREHISKQLRNVTAYLAIDTLSFYKLEQEDPAIAKSLGTDDYLYAGGFNPVDYIHRTYRSDPNLQRWWDKSFHPPYTYIDDGARRFRMLGRLALYRIKEDFHSKLAGKVKQVVELNREMVNRGIIQVTEEHLNEVQIYLVTGSNGGTGSGMFFDALFHAFAAVKEVGDLLPRIRIIVVSPRVYIHMASESGSGLANALAANAYAFFQSLSFIVEKPTEAIKYVFDYYTNSHMQNLQENLNEHWRPDKIHIIDTEVAGKEIADLDGMLTLAADYLFLDITQPVSIGAASVVNLEQVLEETYRGHKRILSSFGISYLVMPVLTIAKGLTATLMAKVLKEIEEKTKETSQSPQQSETESYVLSETDKSKVEEGVELLYGWLKTCENGKHGGGGADNFSKWAKDARVEVLSAFRNRFNTEKVSGEIGRQIKETQKAISEKKKSLMRKMIILVGAGGILFAILGAAASGAAGFMVALAGIPAFLGGILGLILGSGLGFLAWFFLTGSEREERKDAENKEKKLNEITGEVTRLVEKELQEKKAQVETSRKKTSEKVKSVAELLLNIVNHYLSGPAFRTEPDELTSPNTSIYIWGYVQDQENADEYKLIMGAPTQERAEEMLHILFPKESTGNQQEKGFRIPEDLINAVQKIIEDKAPEPKGGSDKVSLSMEERNDILKAIVEVLLKEIMDAYKRNLGKKGESDMDLMLGLAAFKDDVMRKLRDSLKETGENLRNLSDPTWAYYTDVTPSTRRISPRHLVPVACFKSFKDVWSDGTDRVKGILNDKRIAITVQSEYGVPIFAIRGIREWKEKYDVWAREWRAKNEAPSHPDKRWDTDTAVEGGPKGILPDLEPDDSDRIMESYLMLLFMGAFMENEKSNALWGLKNSKGDTFGAFWSKINRLWERGDGTTVSEKVEDDQPMTPERFYDLMRQQFECFRNHVRHEQWILGDVAEFWDKMRAHTEFRKHFEERRRNIHLLAECLSGRMLLEEDREKALIKDLESIFRAKRVLQKDYEDSQGENILSIIALALSRIR